MREPAHAAVHNNAGGRGIKVNICALQHNRMGDAVRRMVGQDDGAAKKKGRPGGRP
jgi:hypothetical protein